jgi:hypothetical protein
MNPTTRSLAAVGVSEPDPGELLLVEVPVETSTGEVVEIPENSWTSIETVVALPVWTVTLVAGRALAAYHISPSELWPDELKAPILVQVLPEESVTEAIGLEVPV